MVRGGFAKMGSFCRHWCRSLTSGLTGAGARSAEGTGIGHENAEGMAYVGVRVEPTVSLVTGAETVDLLMPDKVGVPPTV